MLVRYGKTGGIRIHTSDTILAVVKEGNHAVGVHRLAGVLITMVSR